MIRVMALALGSLLLVACDGYNYDTSLYESSSDQGVATACVRQALEDSPRVEALSERSGGYTFLFESMEGQIEFVEEGDWVRTFDMRVRSEEESSEVVSAAARQLRTLISGRCEAHQPSTVMPE